jgi:RNA polymerase sigma-70 factor (ECF subfamily)
VTAFLAAARGGSFAALLALLDPDVVLRSDPEAARSGAPGEVRGAAAVAETFSGRARAARPALLGGEPGAVWMSGGRARVAFLFAIRDRHVTGIEILAEPERLAALDPVVLE